ncbi:splicing regulator SDE2-like, partial [Haliotis asinina]|uniref:splicing regulator SDE2-like n=1 Tax=Haliotis asinina TaxID=109174 RepID=UPI003531DE38
LKDWLSKQADREREKEEKRQERLARRRACPQHNFDDPQYVAQRSQVAEDLDDALQTALVRDKTGPSATVTSADITRKRRAASETLMKAKRQRGWLGIDPDDLSSESSDDDKESSSKDGVVTEESSDGLTPKDDTPCSNSKKDGVVTEESSDGHTPKDDTPCSNESTTDVSASAESSPSISSHSRSAEGNKYSIESEVKDGREITAESHTLLSSLPSSVNINKLEDIDLSEFSSASELEVIGMDRLKFALTQRGLKCGGTVEQRAERLFSVKGLTHDQIDPSLFPKTQNVRHKKK